MAKDVLYDAAASAVYEDEISEELKTHIQETYNITNHKHLQFLLIYFLTGCFAYKAYQQVYPGCKLESAKTAASNLITRYNIPAVTILDVAGHGVDTMMQTLTTLRKSNPDAYMKHILKMRGLDQKKVEVSGSIQLPIINIITEKDD